MHTPERDKKILHNLQYGRSNKNQAGRVQMSVADYLERKTYLVEQRNSTSKDKIVEQSFDMDKGTGTLKGYFSKEPMSAVEIEVMFKIDLTKWRLSTYWNKAQTNGTFLVSANITRKKETDEDVISEDMIGAIRAVFSETAVTPFTCVHGPSNEKSLMVYTSDKHVGAVVPENALYVNNFNAQSFEERMMLLLKEIFYLETMYGKFENIYILDMGDALDGWNGQTTRTGHSLPQNMNNRQAFETYLKTHKTFFDLLITSGVANNYYFKALTNDNHASDFGYITNRALEEYLNVKYPQVETQIMSKFLEHFVLGNHTFILTHGKDDIDMKHGLALHLTDKITNFINNYIDEHDIDAKKTKIHLIKGDLHQDCSESSSKFRYRNTCSMFGSSKWAMHNFIPQAPGVSFDIIENDTNRVFEYKLLYNTKSTTTA